MHGAVPPFKGDPQLGVSLGAFRDGQGGAQAVGRAEAPTPDGPAGYMKSFNAALCETCIEQVKAAYLRIGKPRSLRAAGVIFFGTPYRLSATLPIPERTQADAELWITLEGWDGSMHQASIPLSEASPATIAWLAQQGGKR